MAANLEFREKLKTLVPYGCVVTRSWLLKKGVGSHTIDNLVKSKQLLPVSSGVYQRVEIKLDWKECRGFTAEHGTFISGWWFDRN